MGSRRLLLAIAAVCACALAPRTAAQGRGQTCEPVSVVLIEDYLKAQAPVAVIRKRINDCGIGFVLDDASTRRLRAAGATDALLALFGAPKGTPGARWTPPVDGREMIFVGGGTVTLGSPANESDRRPEETQNQTTVANGFWLDTTEVTKAAFQKFIMATPRWQKRNIDKPSHDGNYLKDWNGTQFPAGEGNRPVVYVSWPAARAYALWAGKRLPTEAEWELAARAGTRSAYWWGDRFDRNRANNGGSVLPAGGADTRRNPWGFYDMLGNVAEWTSTVYRPYPYSADDGRERADDTGARVVRGGAWGQDNGSLRAARRASVPTTVATDTIGFRCAR